MRGVDAERTRSCSPSAAIVAIFLMFRCVTTFLLSLLILVPRIVIGSARLSLTVIIVCLIAIFAGMIVVRLSGVSRTG
jgi:uncharacterized membrane protein